MVEDVGIAEQEMGQRMCQEHSWSAKAEGNAGLDWLRSLLTPKNKGPATSVILKSPFGVVSAHPETQQ